MNKMTKTNVYKFGTKCIFNEKDELDYDLMKEKADEIKSLPYKPILVVSGAITLGKMMMNEKRPDLERHEKASYASIGQLLLMDFYKKIFYPTPIAQILVTPNDLRKRNHLYRTIMTNFSHGFITAINSNDPTYYGETDKDNDVPAGLVCVRTKAENLVLFARGYEGFYMDGQLIRHIPKVERVHYDSCKASSKNGIGGFTPKLKAGQIVRVNGGRTFIANVENSLEKILKGEVGTVIG